MTSRSKGEARATMAAWRDYRGHTPLGGATQGHPVDRCSPYLSDAVSILSMLSAGFEDSQALLAGGNDSVFDNRPGSIMAGALDGVSTLIDLAAFLLSDD